MTIKERADQGYQLKANGICNCAQAVINTFQDKLNIDNNISSQIASGFAAGMGGMEGTCGAIVGAVMVAGLLTQGKSTPRIARDIINNFKQKSGATICKDLKTMTDGKPLCECPQCVHNAITVLGECLEIND